jgi:hypothetical protein
VEESVDQQKLNDYRIRISEWIGNQGILFQLRYARTSGAGSLLRQFGSIVVRIVIVLAVLTGCGYLLFENHFSTDRYRDEISRRIEKSLGLTSIDGTGFSRSAGSGGYRDLSLEGGDASFFYQAKLEGFNAPFEYLTGITGDWNPDAIRARKAEINIKAGGSQDEMEESFAGLLETFSGQGVVSVRIDDFSCDWGYSKMTYGRISNADFKADFEGGEWKVKLEGGKFQQNWLKNLVIKSADLTVDETGIRVQSLDLGSDSGTLSLSGKIGGPLSRPEFDLSGDFRKLAIQDILRVEGIEIRDFIEGWITGKLKITGSTNQHINIEGSARIEGGDQITIRERWTILKAISIIDSQRTFRRVDFNSGSFKFASSEGGLKIEELTLSADKTAKLQGDFETRFPTQKEAAEKLEITLTEGFSSDLTDTSSAQKLEDERVSLRNALGRSGKLDDLNIDRSLTDLPGGDETQLSARELEEARLRAEMRVHRINGFLKLAIPATAFDSNENLAGLYPADAEGWRWIEIPLEESSFSEISSKANEKILDQGRTRAGNGPDVEMELNN